MRSATRCAGSRSCPIVQSDAYPSVTSFGRRVIDQPLGERVRQHHVPLRHGDEAVAHPMIPELRSPGLADATMKIGQLHEMARAAGGRRKHEARLLPAPGPAPVENGRKLPGDRQLKRHTGLGLLHTEDPLLPVHPVPLERLAPRRAACRMNMPNQNTSLSAGLLTTASMPFRQRGRTSAGGGILRRGL